MGEHPVEVAVLGPVEAAVDGTPATLGGAKQRTVLAVLALTPGKTVSVADIVSAVWGDDAAGRGRETVQVYASNLRRALGGSVVQYRAPGYLLAVPDEAVDLGRFRARMRAARSALRDSAPDDAATLIREALSLWRGAPLGGLSADGTIAREATLLAAERAAALELRLDIELDLGQARELVVELQDLVARNPLDEGLAARLMLALYRSGRQGDALDVARRVRAVLADELGVDPGPHLRELEAAILAQSPALLVTGGGAHGHETTTYWVPSGRRASLRLPGGRHVTLADEPVVLGRADACDVTIEHRSVSRRHASVRPDGPGFVVVDLGSTNGTRLNGDALVANEPRRLADGDEILVGAVSVRYTAPSSA